MFFKRTIDIHDNPIMVDFLQKVKNGQINCFAINRSMICTNFVESDDPRFVWKGQVIKFSSYGYKPLKQSELRQVKKQLVNEVMLLRGTLHKRTVDISWNDNLVDDYGNWTKRVICITAYWIGYSKHVKIKPSGKSWS